jgi:hypothetical protein
MSDNFKTVFDSLPGNFGARAKALAEAREIKGTNVHFLRAGGVHDRYSFPDTESADKFRASLRRAGRTIIETEN